MVLAGVCALIAGLFLFQWARLVLRTAALANVPRGGAHGPLSGPVAGHVLMGVAATLGLGAILCFVMA